jgi:hypothetical protein
MKVAVIGAGAMGCIYGTYLSRKNDVLLVDVVKAHVDAINERGLEFVHLDGTTEDIQAEGDHGHEGLSRGGSCHTADQGLSERRGAAGEQVPHRTRQYRALAPERLRQLRRDSEVCA